MGKVFISYSQDSADHSEKVKNFADNLRRLGVDAELDKYTPTPSLGWPTYMVQNILESEFVICVCSAKYKNRFEQRDPIGTGKGAKFEGKLITDIIYEAEINDKFIPVFIDDNNDTSLIPLVLLSYTRYTISNNNDFINLYARLTNQQKIAKPELGTIVPIKTLQQDLGIVSAEYKQIKNIKNKCLARFISNGLSREKSQELLDSMLETDIFNYILPQSDKRSRYLIGDFGSGKSLALSILHLQQLKNERASFLISAVDIPNDITLDRYLEINDISAETIFFIDGLDEVSYHFARKIIEAIILCETCNEKVRFVVSSRPNTAIDERCNTIRIRDLSLDESFSLIKNIVGDQIPEARIRALGDKFQDTIVNPFFAILVGEYLIKSGNIITSKQDLIKFLITNSVAPINYSDTILEQLKKLSVKYINNQMNKILISELDRSIKLSDILSTGLLQLDGDYISFGLPIIPQWLAAEAIRDRYLDVEEIIKTDASIIRWRYPLMILFGNLSFEESKTIFARIVETYPGIASKIIRDNIINEYIESLPSDEQCAEMILTCMNTWIKSLGNISKVIAPMDGEQLSTFHIIVSRAHRSSICLCWEQRNTGVPYIIARDVPQIPMYLISKGVIKSSVWPWIYTFEYLSDNLKKYIESSPSFLNVPDLREEVFYDIARSFLNKDSLYREDIELSALSPYKRFRMASIKKHSAFSVNLFFEQIEKLESNGETHLKYPHTRPDIELTNGGWVWDLYSYKKQLELVRCVYGKALTAYQKLVDDIFSTLRNTMPLYLMLPAKLKISYYLQGDEKHPCIQWYLLCKQSTEDNELVIEERKSEHEEYMKFFGEIKKSIDRYRFSNAELCSVTLHSQLLELFNEFPLTKIVLNWLKNDLKSIGWID